MTPLRIGTLGAARITPFALIRPASRCPDIDVVAVAARDPERAQAYAHRHGISRVHQTYDDLLADPEIDAVYNPLPNGLHGVWTIRALEAGKHVLCEKPFTANAAEAREVAAVESRTGLVVMEAFHYRHHPVAQRAAEIVHGGDLGEVTHIETFMCVPVPTPGDIRYDLALAGGALMDTGCYAVNMMRLLGGAEPEVVSAQVKEMRPGVDRAARAEVSFGDGRSGVIRCALLSARLLDIRMKVVGSEATMTVLNPVGPMVYHHIRTRYGDRTVTERLTRRHTYDFQLDNFVAAVRHGTPVLTGTADAIANMEVIDAVYLAAGLSPRQPTEQI